MLPASDRFHGEYLAVSERRPYLSLLTLPEGAHRPLLAAAGVPADGAIVRRGWLALEYNNTAVAVHLPIRVDTIPLWEARYPVAHLDPALLWVRDDEEHSWVAVDRHGSQTGDRVRLVDDDRLEAVGAGSVLVRRPSGSLAVGPVEDLRPLTYDDVIAQAGARVLVVRRRADAAVLDLATGAVTPVAPDGFRSWDSLGSVSPNGRYVAVSGGIAPPAPGPDDGEPFRAYLDRTRNDPPPASERVLALVDLSHGTCRSVPGEFDNFAIPVWAPDSRSLVFSIPFEAPTTLGWVHLDEFVLHRLRLPARSPIPLHQLQ